MKKIVLTAAMLLASSAANACGFIGQPPCFQQPAPPTTFQTFGNQTMVTTPGQPMTTINRFGNQTMINTPGQPMRTCQTFGFQTICH